MQIKETQIIRLANIMGMDIEDKQHQLAIHDSIINVSSIDDFTDYCRNNKDSIDYANRLDKLEYLFSRYKNTIDNIPTEKLERFCFDLAEKFKIAIQMLRDNEEVFDGHMERLKIDSIQYFMNKEIELMDSIGGLNRLLNLFELGTLYESLYEKSVKLTINKNNNVQLTDGQKRVKKLIGGVK